MSAAQDCKAEVKRGDLLTGIANLSARWRVGDLEPALFAGLYFFYWQIALHGERFASRKRRIDSRPAVPEWIGDISFASVGDVRLDLLEWLDRYHFRGVRESVPIALREWLQGNWPLCLRDDVPTPVEVLRAQVAGTRPVTAIVSFPRLLQPVLGKPDAFAFFVHDLEHAYKFFHSSDLHAGQRAFFRSLLNAFETGTFERHLADRIFVEKFHYLMSDMNTHPAHSVQYLRAILIEYWRRQEGKASGVPLSLSAERDIAGAMEPFAPPMLLAAGA